jgi:hypothetical protein
LPKSRFTRVVAAAASLTVATFLPGLASGSTTHTGADSWSAAGVTGTPYPCTTSDDSQFQSGTGYGVDVAAIGWLGNDEGAVACLGGSFYVQNSIDTTYGFGVYNYTPTTWTDVDGYLPALVTSFKDRGAKVAITNFGDRVVIGGNAYVAIYSQVAVTNPTTKSIRINPEPSAGLVALNRASDVVAPGKTVDHDYVVASDRFGASYAWPTSAQLKAAGTWAAHFAHMKNFWNGQLAQLAKLSLPDQQLVNSYKAGFIYTEIDRSGVALDTGTNGYHAEYEHDVIGILANLFNEGDYSDAHALLNEVDTVVGTNGQYSDGLWTYPWLWAVYLEKTGDLSFVKAHFDTAGTLGSAKQPSIETTAHETAADRTGPGGIMEETSDIDANGYWTSDNLEALLGLDAYVYVAKAVGNTAEATWGEAQYKSLLKDVNTTLAATTKKYNLDYLPCSMVEPNSQNRCDDPLDANWAAPGVYTNAAWHGSLFGASGAGPDGKSMATWIGNTLKYGFARSKGVLPSTTFGGYPGEGFWSTAYNAGYGAWGLSTSSYRDESILAQEWMIANDQAGPYSWWEGSAAPTDSTPWIGNHPASSGGASPHSWGINLAAQGLIDSLASQKSDGTLIVGRGVPNDWLAAGKKVAITNFPTSNGKRVGLTIRSTGSAVTLAVTGTPSGPVEFDLPAFVKNVASTSAGTVDEAAGTVTIPATTRHVTVKLRSLKLTPAATSLRVDSPAAIHAAPGGATTVTSTFADSGPGAVTALKLGLDAPAGWKVTADGTTTASHVAAGATVTGTWTVTAPTGGSGTQTAALKAVAGYTDSTTGDHETDSVRQLGAPGISSIAPTSGAAGTTVTLHGSDFGPSQGTVSAVQLTDDGTVWGQQGELPSLTIKKWTNTAITFVLPTGSGTAGTEYQLVPGTTATVQVVTAGGSSNAVGVTVKS